MVQRSGSIHKWKIRSRLKRTQHLGRFSARLISVDFDLISSEEINHCTATQEVTVSQPFAPGTPSLQASMTVDIGTTS